MLLVSWMEPPGSPVTDSDRLPRLGHARDATVLPIAIEALMLEGLDAADRSPRGHPPGGPSGDVVARRVKIAASRLGYGSRRGRLSKGV